jgi:hypothetical protein
LNHWEALGRYLEQGYLAIDDCLDKMASDHKQAAATLFVHQFQRFEGVPILAA